MTTLLLDEYFQDDNDTYRVQLSRGATGAATMWISREQWSVSVQVLTGRPGIYYDGVIRSTIIIRSPWVLSSRSEYATDNIAFEISRLLAVQETICECGGTKANTTHSHWCPSYRGKS